MSGKLNLVALSPFRRGTRESNTVCKPTGNGAKRFRTIVERRELAKLGEREARETTPRIGKDHVDGKNRLREIWHSKPIIPATAQKARVLGLTARTSFPKINQKTKRDDRTKSQTARVRIRK